jgi:hypothetical protein
MTEALPPSDPDRGNGTEGYDVQLPYATQSRDRARVLTEEEEQIIAAYRRNAEKSFRSFYGGIQVDLGGVSRMFDCVAAPFQRKSFEEMTESLEQLRRGDVPKCQRFWIERTKKSSKDADIAILVLWLIAFPLRPFLVQIGAADSEQAGIIKDRVNRLLHWNPWLKEHVEVQFNQIKSKRVIEGTKTPMAVCNILAADESGGHGGTPDLMIVNELTHITKWGFVQTLLDNADGVPRGVAIIVTNAGFKGTAPEAMRNHAMSSPDWTVNILQGPAPWHSMQFLRNARARSAPSRYKRLWQGFWVSGVGDAVDESKIDIAFCLSGPLKQRENNWEYIMGVDLGVKHDHSAVFVLGMNPFEQKLKAAYWQAWKPLEATGEVDLRDVRATIKMLNDRYGVSAVWFDPHQAALMAQDLMAAGLNMQEMSFSPLSNREKMACSYVQVMNLGILQLYDDSTGTLRRDLGKFVIEEKVALARDKGTDREGTGFGAVLKAVSDEYGHADVGTAMIITLPAAVDCLGLSNSHLDELQPVDRKPLTKEEIDGMDTGLREIFELDSGRGGQRMSDYGYGGKLDDIDDLD